MKQIAILIIFVLSQLFYMVDSFVFGIVNGTEYYVQNNGTNLARKFVDFSVYYGEIETFLPGSLIANGILLTEKCKGQDVPIPHHQWMVHYKNNHNLIDLTSAATASYFSKTLYANITGQFIQYFKNFVLIDKLDVHNDSDNQYLVKNAKSNECVFSRGENETAVFSECKSNDANQVWHFIIVQEPVNTDNKCTKFWGCRKSLN